MIRHLAILAALAVAPLAHAQSLAAGGPVDITAQKLDVHNQQGNAVFSGSVVVTQGSLTLKAPTLTVTYATGGGDIKQLTATGGVTITRDAAEKATGDAATYTPATQRLVMTGNVTLMRGPSTLEGDKLVYNIATGNAQVTNSAGPVKARFVPSSAKGAAQ